MAKRISLSERRAADSPRGVDVLFNAPSASSEEVTTGHPVPENPSVGGEASATSEEVSSEPSSKGIGPMDAVSVDAVSVLLASELKRAETETPAVEVANARRGKTSEKTLDGSDASGSASGKPILAKATVYIRPDQVITIESIQLSIRQKTGQKPDKSDLFQEAVDLLAAKYGLL